MSASEIFSVVSSVVSVILGVFAIWLSVMFYRWSSDASEKVSDSAKSIAASVTRLESLFDRLYADTFSMVKDTVSDMRRHAWPELDRGPSVTEEIEKRSEERLAAMQAQVSEQISHVLAKLDLTEGRLTAVAGEVEQVVKRAVVETRQIETEVRDQTLREKIVSTLESEPGGLEAIELAMRRLRAFPFSEVMDEILKLRREGILRWNGEDTPDASTVIRLTQRGRRSEGLPVGA